MHIIGPTLFPIALLFFAGLCYFGVRRDRAPWSIFAIIAFAVLAVWGCIYLEELARLWSGRPRQVNRIGVEVFVAFAFVAWKHRAWLAAADAYRGRFQPRAVRGLGRPHAGG
jgi:hypothetical protein